MEISGKKQGDGNGLKTVQEPLMKNTDRTISADKRPCLANIWVFLVLLCFTMIMPLLVVVYTIGMIRTLEKQFGFTSTQTNSLLAIPDISYMLLVLVVSHFGQRSHRPRILAFCCLSFFIGCCILVSTHFIFGTTDSNGAVNILVNSTDPKQSNGFHQKYTSYSYANSTYETTDSEIRFRPESMCVKTDGTNSTDCSASGSRDGGNKYAYGMLLAGFIIADFGQPALHPLGISFIDDNVSDKSRTGFFIGIISSMYAFGPGLGYALAAFCNKLSVDLKPTTLTPSDPRWIGCWWLGYVLIGAASLILSAALFAFPRHINPKNMEKVSREPAKPKQKTSITAALKGLCRSICQICKQKGYLLLIACHLFALYIIITLYMNGQRYYEIHFYKPAFVASIVTGISGPIGSAIGFVLSGYLLSRFQVKPPTAAKIIFVSSVIVVVCISVLSTLSCPQITVAGLQQHAKSGSNLETSCNSECDCKPSKKTYQPVCDTSTQTTYFSPCHAGCQNDLHNCSCTSDNSTLVAGQCTPDCDTTFYIYAAVILCMNICASFGKVPITILQIRIVKPENKALGLGFGGFVFHLIAFIPGPMIIGSLIDSACLLWEKTCGDRGACLYYNNTSLRLLIHLTSVGCIIITCILALLLWFTMRKDAGKKHDADLTDSDMEVTQRRTDK